VWDDTLPGPCWNIEIDVPESLIQAYLDNTSSDGLFVGAEKTDADINIFYGDQWSQQANIRVTIGQPPQDAPWIVLDKTSIDLTVALSDPVASPVTVTVTNAGVGSLAWTASENPNETWMSLQSASGSDGDSFDVLVDVTGQSVGTLTGTIEVSDSNANNNPQLIAVTVDVLASQLPVIELVPASLDLQIPSGDPAPAPIPVTVNNIGFPSLSWTATVQGSPSWLWVTSNTGSDGDAFNVNVDHTSLANGSYSADIAVTDPTASNSPQTLTVDLEVRDQDADIDTANSYDDAWESGPGGWIDYCQTLAGGWSGTSGFVVHLGDSITYANAFGQWARYGSGKTGDDTAICNWMHSDEWPGGGNDSASGWYLAAYDMPGGRSYTAESGIRTDQYLAGSADLPSSDEMFTTGYTNPDGKQYTDAQMATVMLGTNDASSNRTTQDMIDDLEAIVDKVLANDTIVMT
jgi:hypothetical protein